jgi:hypothetical protein
MRKHTLQTRLLKPCGEHDAYVINRRQRHARAHTWNIGADDAMRGYTPLMRSDDIAICALQSKRKRSGIVFTEDRMECGEKGGCMNLNIQALESERLMSFSDIEPVEQQLSFEKGKHSKNSREHKTKLKT